MSEQIAGELDKPESEEEMKKKFFKKSKRTTTSITEEIELALEEEED